MIRDLDDAKKALQRLEFRHPNWKIEVSDMSAEGPLGDEVLVISIKGIILDAEQYDPASKAKPKTTEHILHRRERFPLAEDHFFSVARMTLREAWAAAADRHLYKDGASW